MNAALVIPELGQLAMILAICFAAVQASVPLLGAWRGDSLWMSLARPAAWGQFAFLTFAFACLTHAFMTDNFSVAYVASNSNSALPWYFKFSAVWGAHEGSLLLWALILGGWTFAVSVFSRQLPQVMLARVLAVMGMISVGFLSFLIITSNPFQRLLPQVPTDGRDLNPLLQDIGLIVHPPMLYMGYVGFSVAFAFAIAAFSLSLLGTFLVRSGVLTSVHAFAADPSRGVFILIFLLFVVGGSLTLFALRAPVVKSQVGFALWSRETLLLANNLVLVVAASMILLGTLYPLVLDALTGAKLSVGPPYFDALFLPLMALLMVVLGVGVVVRWKDTPGKWLASMMTPVLIGSAVLAPVAGFIVDDFDWPTLTAFALAAWVVLSGLRDVLDKTRHKGLAKGMRGLTRSYWGMQLAHLGLAVCALGVVLSSNNSAERDLRMAPGESVELGGYHFLFQGAKHFEGPNFISDKGTVVVSRDGREVTTLHPEKRLYTVQQSMMTEAGIDAGFTRDLYVALGEPLENGAWAVRVHIKPYVRWIWLGGLLTGLGGLLAALDRRYRVKVKTRVRDVLGVSGAAA